MQPFIVSGYVDFSETRLIDHTGRFIQSIGMSQAKQIARDVAMDLVCFNKPEGSDKALCKIINFGKWKYNQEKTEKKEKNKTKIETKEVRFSPVIDSHDIEHKVKQIIGFLEDGNIVMVTMRFKGIHHRIKDEGKRIVDEIVEKCKCHGKEAYRKQDNDNISVRLVKV